MSDLILRFIQLKNIVPLSRATIWRMEKAGTFPQRVHLSRGTVGWRMSEVQAWLDSRQQVVGVDQVLSNNS